MLNSLIFLAFTHLIEMGSAKLLAPLAALLSKKSYPHINHFHKHKHFTQNRNQHANPLPYSAYVPRQRSADEQPVGLSIEREISKEDGRNGL